MADEEVMLLADFPLEKNRPVAQLFRISSLELKTTKADGTPCKRPYLQFTVGDRSGQVERCKKWDSSEEEFNRLKPHKVLFVTGKTDIYKETLQIVADTLAQPEEGTEAAHLEELTPSTAYDIKFLKKELWRFIQSIENKHIKQLCELFLQEPDVKEKISSTPGAISYHHNYKGGLLTHIVRLLYLADSTVNAFNQFMYPNGKYKINRDVVIFLSFIHDIFKIFEYAGPSEYNIEGNLIDHLAMAPVRANRLMDKIPDFPEEIRKQLTHGLFAHHGKKEYGSPVSPCTVEAMLLHHLDNLASKVDPMLEALDALPAGQVWTDRIKSIEKPAYMGGMLITQLTEAAKAEQNPPGVDE